jgi:hypothetical protein
MGADMATKRPNSIEEYQRKRAAQKAGTRLPPRTHNQPSDLPTLNEQLYIYAENARAAAQILRKTFETWLEIGRFLKALHDWADEIGGKKTYDKLREREGLGKDIINKTRSSRLLKIIDNLPAVEAWRATLTGTQRFEWASPEAVHRHCPVFAKPKAPDTTGKSNRAKAAFGALKDAHDKINQLTAHVQELEAARETPVKAKSLTLKQLLDAVVKELQDAPEETVRDTPDGL